MSYVRKHLYKIEPMESYKVIRNCSGCGCKTLYYNTDNFRVNANGTKIDIWLIYQCEGCKHTFNLSIHKRVKADDIQHNLYERFLSNEVLLSKMYGMDKSLFARNGAVIDAKSLDYKVETVVNIDFDGADKNDWGFRPGDLIQVDNNFGLKVRVDKIASDILNVSRTKVSKLEDSGLIIMATDNQGKSFSIQIIGEV